MAFIHLEVFKGIIYLEPGKNYEIVLPKKVQKLPEDELNPFFEETEFYIRILNGNDQDLNHLIGTFSEQYQKYLEKYFDQFKGQLNKTVTDSIIFALEKAFPATDNPFFNNYRLFSYHSLRLLAYDRNREKFIESVFYDHPVLDQNPAYMELFNQIFSNYLSAFSKSEFGKEIPYFLIREKSYSKIKLALEQAPFFKDKRLTDLIIIKSLFDNFYREDFPQESIIFTLDSIRTSSTDKIYRTIAGNVLEKITNLLLNYPAPEFELPDKSNKLHSLGNFNGKFVYLSFMNPRSYTSLQELEVLKKLNSRNFEMLEIITICSCSKMEEMQKLIKEKSYNWKFLYYAGNLDLIKSYNVKVYPTYYMINPEGKLAMLPAFPPTEPSFEARYLDMLRSWKNELERRKSKGLQR
jgi:peroxiredoxin